MYVKNVCTNQQLFAVITYCKNLKYLCTQHQYLRPHIAAKTDQHGLDMRTQEKPHHLMDCNLQLQYLRLRITAIFLKCELLRLTYLLSNSAQNAKKVILWSMYLRIQIAAINTQMCCMHRYARAHLYWLIGQCCMHHACVHQSGSYFACTHYSILTAHTKVQTSNQKPLEHNQTS